MRLRWVCLLLWALAWPCLAETEAERLAEFVKEYRDPDSAARMRALERLSGAQENATWIRLSQVFYGDKIQVVQEKALKVLCTGVDKDGALAACVAKLFTDIKVLDRKVALCEELAKLEFKHAPLRALITDLLESQVYQLDPDNNFYRDAEYQRALKLAAKNRADFAHCLKVINQVAGTEFEASAQCKNEIRTWWKNGGEVEAMKRDMVLKTEKEKAARAAKSAPPKTDPPVKADPAHAAPPATADAGSAAPADKGGAPSDQGKTGVADPADKPDAGGAGSEGNTTAGPADKPEAGQAAEPPGAKPPAPQPPAGRRVVFAMDFNKPNWGRILPVNGNEFRGEVFADPTGGRGNVLSATTLYDTPNSYLGAAAHTELPPGASYTVGPNTCFELQVYYEGLADPGIWLDIKGRREDQKIVGRMLLGNVQAKTWQKVTVLVSEDNMVAYKGREDAMPKNGDRFVQISFLADLGRTRRVEKLLFRNLVIYELPKK